MKTLKSYGHRIWAGMARNHDLKEGLPGFRGAVLTEVLCKSAGLAICFLFIGFVKLSAAPLTGAELMRLVRDRNNSSSQVSHVTMLLSDRKGRSQKRELKIWAEQTEESENTLTRFVAPRRVAGVGFLVVNKEGLPYRYLYTPTEKKTRRVPEGDNKKSFQGTDFTYYDLSPHDAESEIYEPLRSQVLDGHDCWVCESNPSEESGLYSRVIQWIRKDVLVPVKIEFYDLRGKLLKVMQVTSLEEIDGYWTPIETIMHNVQTDHRTAMRVDGIRFNVEFPRRFFSKMNLEQVR